jgi:acyl-coenzyme A thioesterase PaaI-like protein
MQFASPGTLLCTTWRTLRGLPGGRWAFGRLVGLLAPYSGSIAPSIEEVRPGYARVTIRDRRRLRNHLESVHAVALANLCELTSGLAMLAALPGGVRGILTGLSVTYRRKARGRITAECSCIVPPVSEAVEHEIEVCARDGGGEVVVEARAQWRLALASRPTS